ncbi:MAG: toll/interleukin-1 receptor domain-containing protein [Phycisphaerae bacterium]|nr:toll/interleukin-1 receptor domain-containing protein [Phycisphaerae bacterium]
MIFVSYAHEDEDQARGIVRALTKRGYTVWFDKAALLPGQKWKPTIERAIRQASVFLAVLSQRAVSKRGFVQREMKVALEVLEEMPEDAVFVIPVRLDDCVVTDSRLRQLHYVDLFPDSESAIDKVVQAMAAAKAPCSHLTSPNDVPKISLFSVEPTHIVNGGKVRILVQAASVAPVVWLNRSLDGPRGSIYGGGAGCVFAKAGRDLWEISWVEAISRWAPSGVYQLSKISVRNESDQISEDARPKSLLVENEALSDGPVIESVILSSHRVAAGDSLLNFA